MGKKSIRDKVTEVIFNIARYTELIISIIITSVIILLIVQLVQDLLHTPFLNLESGYFLSFLSTSLNLVVGVEFIKMLCKHTPETLVEVLMFATARQMVVEHLSTWETLVGVISIGILFAIRKYLFIHASDHRHLEDKF